MALKAVFDSSTRLESTLRQGFEGWTSAESRFFLFPKAKKKNSEILSKARV